MIYKVKLNSGTEFVGDRTWKLRFFNEGFLDRRFKVLESLDSFIPVGSTIVVPLASISFMVKQNKKGD